MPRTLIGTVVSDKMEKTISVEVSYSRMHPLYRKQFKRSKKFLAHDEQNKAKIGDNVEITETRPQSRRKRWQLSKVLTHEEPAK